MRGVGLLTMKPAASAAAVTSADLVGGQVEPDQQSLAAHLGDPRVGGEPVAELLAEHGDVLEQALGLDRADDGERGSAGDRVAAERGAVVAGLEQVTRRADAEAGADREAAAEPLGHGHDVRASPPAAWWANQAPVRPIPVCTSSSHSSAPCSSAVARAAAR